MRKSESYWSSVGVFPFATCCFVALIFYAIGAPTWIALGLICVGIFSGLLVAWICGEDP